MARDVMSDIRLFQVVHFEIPHERGDRKKTSTVTSEKQLSWNDHVDRGQLPTGLLVDSCIQHVVVGNDGAADFKYRLTLQIFMTGKLVFGALLIRDQASPAQVFFQGVFLVVLEIGVLIQFDRVATERADAKPFSRLKIIQIFCLKFRCDWVRNIRPCYRFLQFFETSRMTNGFNLCQVNPVAGCYFGQVSVDGRHFVFRG